MSKNKVTIIRGGYKTFNVTLQTQASDSDTPEAFDLSSAQSASAFFKNEDESILAVTDLDNLNYTNPHCGILSIDLTEEQTTALELSDAGDMDIHVKVSDKTTVWSFEDTIIVKDPLVK